jgi:hypothetical protein
LINGYYLKRLNFARLSNINSWNIGRIWIKWTSWYIDFFSSDVFLYYFKITFSSRLLQLKITLRLTILFHFLLKLKFYFLEKLHFEFKLLFRISGVAAFNETEISTEIFVWSYNKSPSCFCDERIWEKIIIHFQISAITNHNINHPIE